MTFGPQSETNEDELFRELAGMAVVAGEIFVDGIDVEEAVAFGTQLRELFATPLREDGMARVAIVCRDARLAVGGLVGTIVAAETTGKILVAQVVRVGAPVGFHLREKVVVIDVLDFAYEGSELRSAGVFGVKGVGDFVHGFGLGGIFLDEHGDGVRFDPGQSGIDFARSEGAIHGVVG